jgi:hypothetical protein
MEPINSESLYLPNRVVTKFIKQLIQDLGEATTLVPWLMKQQARQVLSVSIKLL